MKALICNDGTGLNIRNNWPLDNLDKFEVIVIEADYEENSNPPNVNRYIFVKNNDSLNDLRLKFGKKTGSNMISGTNHACQGIHSFWSITTQELVVGFLKSQSYEVEVLEKIEKMEVVK